MLFSSSSFIEHIETNYCELKDTEVLEAVNETYRVF